MRVTPGKSRVRESRMPGSVRAKAEWLSYSTVTPPSGESIANLTSSNGRFSSLAQYEFQASLVLVLPISIFVEDSQHGFRAVD